MLLIKLDSAHKIQMLRYLPLVKRRFRIPYLLKHTSMDLAPPIFHVPLDRHDLYLSYHGSLANLLHNKPLRSCTSSCLQVLLEPFRKSAKRGLAVVEGAEIKIEDKVERRERRFSRRVGLQRRWAVDEILRVCFCCCLFRFLHALIVQWLFLAAMPR
jgi:hypothetical protein